MFDPKVSTVANSLSKLSDEFSSRVSRSVPILEDCDDQSLVQAIIDNLSQRMIVDLLEVAGQERGQNILNKVASKLEYPALENTPLEESKQEQAGAGILNQFSLEDMKTENTSEKEDNDDASSINDILPALQDSAPHQEKAQKIDLVGAKQSIKQKR